ncbi:DUF2207 domain-containing protein, partial [Lactobacillus sp. XV13L]|nr:DUF2207 domain-containing protein [Lactobacillus sp. XV13L]
MKRTILKLLALVGLLVALVSVTRPVKAEVDYDIENNTAIARVNADGSLTMKRRITYRFDDDAHGVYYTQTLAKGQKIQDLKVWVQDNNQKSKPAQNFQEERYENRERFKVFHAVKEDNRFTVTYRYKITRAITNYRDVAELNFMIIGNAWDSDLDHVKASVVFPVPVKEAALARQANRRRQRNQVFEIILIVVSAIAGVFAIIRGFMTKELGAKPAKIKELAHNYEIPDVDPVTAQVLDTGTNPDSRAFTAYLMQLAAQKRVKIEDYKEGRRTYYRITLLDAELVSQEKLLAALFNDVGNGQS